MILDGVVAVAIAPECAACGSVLDRPLRGPVCEACWAAIHPFSPPLCDGCGDPLPSWRIADGRAGRCARCRRGTRAVDRGAAIGDYQGALRSIIHALKYDGRRAGARGLGDLMRRHGGRVIEGADLAVPVPLHRTRRRARGFNQAEDLALRLGVPVRSVLRRVRATPPQVDLPAARRHRNVAGAFALTRWTRVGPVRWQPTRRVLAGACVLLVDDVSTTGATLEACARVLKAGGARDVRVLTAARVVRRGSY